MDLFGFMNSYAGFNAVRQEADRLRRQEERRACREKGVVYRIKGGDLFHIPSCGLLTGETEAVSVNDAKAAGLTPCNVCFAPEEVDPVDWLKPWP